MPSKRRAALGRTGPPAAAAAAAAEDIAGRALGRAWGDRAGDWESIEKELLAVLVDEVEAEEWAATAARRDSAMVWSSAGV